MDVPGNCQVTPQVAPLGMIPPTALAATENECKYTGGPIYDAKEA